LHPHSVSSVSLFFPTSANRQKKTFSLRPPSPAPAPEPAPEPSRKRKRSRRARTASTVADIEAAREDAELEEEVIEVKAEPFDDDEYVPPVTSAEIEDEENEVQIKDWKPDVTLAYQGELPQLIMICRS
jgi:hypothetical protein